MAVGLATFCHQGTVRALPPSTDINVGDNPRHILPQDAARSADKAQTLDVCRHERDRPACATSSQRPLQSV